MASLPWATGLSVGVICLTGIAEGSELAEGRMLCPEYRDTLDVPLANTVHNIEVPGELVWPSQD